MSMSTIRPATMWIIAGLVGWMLLPWFALPDHFKWSTDVLHLFDKQDTAPALLQSLLFGRWWLELPFVCLVIAAFGTLFARLRTQALVLTLGAGIGVATLLIAGFTIGIQGWSINLLKATLPPLAQGQYGLGWGGMVVLFSLLMLTGIGFARLGYFRGDGFTACAVIGCAALLLLFIGYPVFKALISALQDDMGIWSAAAAIERLDNEKIWGLGCVLGDTRCGVVWNTLFLGLACAAGSTMLGLALALLAERGSKTGKAHGGAWLRLLAMLPIITPPFVIGLGLILLFGRAGLVNQFLEYAFGLTPGRWLYGVHGVWLAQMFALDRKSTRLNSSHGKLSRMPSSA